jgi:hydrogenase-4 component F
VFELTGAILVPIAASGLCWLSGSRRLAAPITVAASVVVLALAVRVALLAAAEGRVGAFDGWLTADGLGALILMLIALVGLSASIFSWGYLGHHVPLRQRTYYVLFNMFMASMLAVPVMANVALMWVAVELTTLLSAFLVGYENTAGALEAAWKYVILTTLGAILALLGFLILYWGSQLAGYTPFTWLGLVQAAAHMPPPLLWPAFLFVLVGFGTKVGLVPLHTWLPDAHSQAPAPICALLSGVETTTVLYVILRLFSVVGQAQGLDARPWFIGFGLISVGAAALLLIRVRDFKRMFAFSTVEHMGIILIAAGLGGAEAHLGAAFQLTAHAIAKSFCFLAAGAVVVATGTQDIGSIRGLSRSSPVAALALVAGGFAIAGAPPFAVFFSEFIILKAGLAGSDYIVVGLLAVFIIIAFCAVMFHVTRMAFGSPEVEPGVHRIPTLCRVALATAAIPLVSIGVYVPSQLQGLLVAAAKAMGQ